MAMAERKKYTITMYREKTGAKAPQALLDLRRRQLEIAQKLTKALGAGPKTVPEVAKETRIAAREVLWYIMTYYKYGLVTVSGKTEEGYYRYALREGRK